MRPPAYPVRPGNEIKRKTGSAALWLCVLLLLANLVSASAAGSSAELPFKTFLPLVANASGKYFVSASGNDINPGSFEQPWRTIGTAAQKVKPGDMVYVRGGIYNEAVSLGISGTAQRMITFQAYPGETPILEGNQHLPTSETALLYVKGDWIRVSGFEVRNSTYYGVQLHGQHDFADHIFAHHSQHNGIYVQGDYGTVESSLVWRNALTNEYNKNGDGSSALTTARDSQDGTTDYAVLRNNTVWENWGIGIDSYESNGTLIEGNLVHDNAIGQIYISDATNVNCTRNFIYMTPGSLTFGFNTNFGILLGDELYTPPSANITLTNNIAYGNNMNLKWYSGVQGGGMKNVLIANNTLVNSLPNNNGNRNIDIGAGPHQNVRIDNNIIVQDDSQPIEDITINPGITLSNNLWSKAPRTANLGSNAIVGNPYFAKINTPYDAAWYGLNASSPAIDSALALPEVTADFLNQPRGTQPDRGALEFNP